MGSGSLLSSASTARRSQPISSLSVLPPVQCKPATPCALPCAAPAATPPSGSKEGSPAKLWASGTPAGSESPANPPSCVGPRWGHAASCRRITLVRRHPRQWLVPSAPLRPRPLPSPRPFPRPMGSPLSSPRGCFAGLVRKSCLWAFWAYTRASSRSQLGAMESPGVRNPSILFAAAESWVILNSRAAASWRSRPSSMSSDVSAAARTCGPCFDSSAMRMSIAQQVCQVSLRCCVSGVLPHTACHHSRTLACPSPRMAQ